MPKTGRSESIGKGQPKWTPGPFHCPTCATERGVSVPKFGTCPHHPSYTTIRAAAPDLYEALDELCEMLPAFVQKCDQLFAYTRGLRALAKARGES